jgi:hypothetical protein
MLERISPLFADLPKAHVQRAERRVGPRAAANAAARGRRGAPGGMSPGWCSCPGERPPAGGAAVEHVPRDRSAATVPLSRQRGHVRVAGAAERRPAGRGRRAVPGDQPPEAAPEPEELRRARLSCDYEADPRRGVLHPAPERRRRPVGLVIQARLATASRRAAPTPPLLQARPRRRPGAAPGCAPRRASRASSPRPPSTTRRSARRASATAPRRGPHRRERAGDPANLEREAPGLLRVEDAVVFTYPEVRP